MTDRTPLLDGVADRLIAREGPPPASVEDILRAFLAETDARGQVHDEQVCEFDGETGEITEQGKTGGKVVCLTPADLAELGLPEKGERE